MVMLRLANGRLVNTDRLNWSPSAGGGSMYDATRLGVAPFPALPLPPPIPGLTARKVTTVPIGADGNPVARRPGPTFEKGMVGRISPPSVPGPRQFARMNANDIIEDRPARIVTQVPARDTIDAVNPLDASRLGLARPSPGPDLLTGSGRSTLLPLPLQAFHRPTVEGNAPAFGGGGGSTPQPPPLIERRDQEWVDKGPDLEALEKIAKGRGQQYGSAFRPEQNGWGSTGFTYAWMNKDVTAPSSPPPIRGTLGPMTFRKGDTVSALARKLGMTTSSFADRYGIANPNKIRAGDTVVPQAGSMPRSAPAGMMRSPPPIPENRVPRPRQRPRESADQVWLEAKGLL